VLRQLPQVTDPNVLVGTTLPDDAGVYRLSDDLAIAQSVDVFTPVVDDPYDYGRIAAANALSDLYAMGARPTVALNIVGFPVGKVPLSVLTEILRGGAEKAQEAGVAILGGHTIDDEEPKYGLAVTGLVHPDRIVTSVGAQPGDYLVLTKPLGIGVITTAHKQGKATPEDVAQAVEVMAALNKGAMEAMLSGVQACTDVTGYGLLGHLYELLLASGVAATIEWETVPILGAAWKYAQMDVFPGGTRANRIFMEGNGLVHWDDAVTPEWQLLLCDAQTSGGLLIAVRPERVEVLVAELQARQTPAAAVIGQVTDGSAGHVWVR